MTEDPTQGLAKVLIKLSGDESPDAESLWARPLGAGLYELRNTPFFAYGLNWGDVVRCAESEERIPLVVEVAERSGHVTLRVFFSEDLPEGARAEVPQRLNGTDASYEQAWGRLCAIAVLPEANLEAVFDFLASEEQGGLLVFETGDAGPTDED